MLCAEIHLSLPSWVSEVVDMDARYPGDEAKVALAIQLSNKNVDHGSGGPFGAVVFDGEDRIISIGVNRVVPQTTSLAHAENMAYMLAQQKLKAPRINAVVQGPVTLATSSQPCCQCYGATVWAGIDHLIIGARAEDVTRLTTFDEGPLPEDWVGCLVKRGIAVTKDILRDEACAVLKVYGEKGPHY
jgi:tRNA(Arg) A34 adenosine deaminase TadA